ncbi:MlaD family protein [Antrihabitans stalactiti]|uniref:MCE family protein n=1 Tax=Antrihabitans stalactiti TaxID=2584121 RepID=A0A848KEN8_9NOCA|nr:MlaD family protein [Antrihabitans stalactiti]NMN96691.1 MCE family protein [Antrihabitans stalactiti]
MKYRVIFVKTVVKLVVAATVSALLFVIVINAIKNPVENAARTYTAEFTDVSGLHVNGDVRAKGVLIGKVRSIDLHSQGERTLADVTFSLQDPYELTDKTQLAIKYQNLTGIRFLDFDQTDTTGHQVERLSSDVTKPSFDITQLFNGLQPVLTTMSTDEINKFTQNAIALIQGDGGGLAPMLDSVQRLSDYAHDREQVISTLTANMQRISDTLGGKSTALLDFMQSMSIPIGQAMTVLDQFGKTAFFGPQFLTPIANIMRKIGLSPELDIDQLLTSAFTSATSAAESLRLLPGALAGLQLPQLQSAPAAMHCSNGIAQLPTEVTVLLNGSEVVVCNAH